MALNFRKIFSGLNIVPRTDGATAPIAQGDLAVSSSDGNLYYNNGSVISAINTNSSSSTLINKTIPVGSNHITCTTNTAAQFNTSTGDLESSVTTATELAFVHGVTSNIQTQINAISGSGITSLTGDVTGTGPGATATTISVNVVSNSKLAQMPTLTIKGNNTGGTANASDLTVAQVNAILPVFTSSLNGLVPASGGGTTNFLRADGTFAAPSGTPLTIGVIDSQSASANGAVIASNTLVMQSASATVPGLINNTSQTFSGTKTFPTIVTQQIAGNDNLLIQSSNAGTLTLLSQVSGQTVITAPNGAAVQQITTPASNPSAGYTKIYPKADNNFYSLDSSGNEKLIGGGGGGALNFVGAVNTNDINFESTIGNWAAFADTTPGPVPTSGLTGGSPAVTITRTTTVGQVLDGVGSGLLTKSAANRQGQGVSVLASVPLGYRGQSATISIPYKVVSGSISSGDLNIFIWDVTNNALVTPSNNGVLGTSGIVQANFTVPSTCAQLRIGFFFSTTSATAVTLSFDDVNINPSTIVLAPFATDWKNDLSWTFSGVGTASGINVFYRRIGDSMEVQGTFTTGTPTGSTFQINFPSGYSIDTTKLPTNASDVGEIIILYTGSPASFPAPSVGPWLVTYDGSTNNTLFVSANTGSNTLTKNTGTDLFNSTQAQSFHFQIPIAGWSSNVITGVVPGMSGSDWSNNLTFGTSTWGTISGSNIFSRRVGDSLQVRGSFVAGTVTGSNAAIGLPSGYVIDSSKLNITGPYQQLGDGVVEGGSAAAVYGNSIGVKISYDGSDNSNVYISYQVSSAGLLKIANNTIANPGNIFTFDFLIPIAGWSVNNGNNPPSQFFASSAITTQSTAIATGGGTVFTTFSNSPAFSVTPLTGGTYSIYASVSIENGSNSNLPNLVRIHNTSGGATLLYENDVEVYSGSTGVLVSPTYIESIYTLIAGNTYVFDIQGSSTSNGLSLGPSSGVGKQYMFGKKLA